MLAIKHFPCRTQLYELALTATNLIFTFKCSDKLLTFKLTNKSEGNVLSQTNSLT